MRPSEVAAVIRTVLGKDLTVGDVHVPVAEWKPHRMRQRPKPADDVIKATGLYVCRPLANADQLLAWVRTQPAFAGLTPDANLHVTVVHSKVELPWTPQKTSIAVPQRAFLGWQLLGAKNALVLRFKSPLLQSRWAQARTDGATWDFDGYQPHMTLCYLETAELPSDLPLPPMSLVFGPEVTGPAYPDEGEESPNVFKTEVAGQPIHITVHVDNHIPTPAATIKKGQIVRNAAGQAVVEVTETPVETP